MRCSQRQTESAHLNRQNARNLVSRKQAPQKMNVTSKINFQIRFRFGIKSKRISIKYIQPVVSYSVHIQ